MTLIQQPARNRRITIDSPVAQEWPVPADVFECFQISSTKQNFFFFVRRLGDYPAERITNERATPKLKPCARRRVPTNVSGLMSHSIHNRDIHAVSNRMCALNGAPGIILRLAKLRFLRRMPTDRRGIKQHVCSLQCRKPCAFRIPLVPTNQCAYAPGSRIKGTEPQIAGSEIKFFVIQWI